MVTDNEWIDVSFGPLSHFESFPSPLFFPSSDGTDLWHLKSLDVLYYCIITNLHKVEQISIHMSAVILTIVNALCHVCVRARRENEWSPVCFRSLAIVNAESA